jgi:hypothetical protein
MIPSRVYIYLGWCTSWSDVDWVESSLWAADSWCTPAWRRGRCTSSTGGASALVLGCSNGVAPFSRPTERDWTVESKSGLSFQTTIEFSKCSTSKTMIIGHSSASVQGRLGWCIPTCSKTLGQNLEAKTQILRLRKSQRQATRHATNLTNKCLNTGKEGRFSPHSAHCLDQV